MPSQFSGDDGSGVGSRAEAKSPVRVSRELFTRQRHRAPHTFRSNAPEIGSKQQTWGAT